MSKKNSKINFGIGLLAIVILICIGMTGQASGKTKGNEHPEAVIKVSALSGKAPLTVQFNGRGSSSPDGTIHRYLWDFGDRANSRRKIVNHTYDTPGSYIAELRVRDSNKGVDTDTVMIEVLPCYIHVEDMSISLIRNEDGSAKAQLCLLITDEEKMPVEDVMVIGRWRGLVKGRSVGITDKSGKAVFESKSTGKSGIIKFSVKRAGTSGCSYRPSQNVVNAIQISTEPEINLVPSACVKAAPIMGSAPHSVDFCGVNSYDSDGSIVSCQWDFGDGEYLNEVEAKHEYLNPGLYEAVLTVTDDKGAVASEVVVITVTLPAEDPEVIITGFDRFSDEEDPGNQKPVAKVSARWAGGEVVNVNFDGGGSYDQDGFVTTYSWDFGDGGSGEGEQVNHRFSSLGSYKVTLTVVDDQGNSSSSAIGLEMNSAGLCYYNIDLSSVQVVK
jgi:PKD repeat protein